MMDTVITAFIIILIAIFAISSFAIAALETQDHLINAQYDLQNRLNDQLNTAIRVIKWEFKDDGKMLEVAVLNAGSTRLADYPHWDVITEYKPDGETAKHIWLPYDALVTIDNEWQIDSFYIDLNRNLLEAYEPNILNPGETMIINLVLDSPVERGTTLQASINTPYGVGTVVYAHRNAPPVLVINESIAVPIGGTRMIDKTDLLAIDIDDLAHSLIYEAITPPMVGALAPGNVFSQSQIDDGKLQYTHIGTTHGIDQFEFTVTDGEDTIGTYVFNIKVSAPPVLLTNDPATLDAGDTITLSPAQLEFTDIDDPVEALLYTILDAPTLGNLSPASIFTQEDLNNGAVTYTHTGGGDDTFMFTVTDGVSTVGPYIFDLQIN